MGEKLSLFLFAIFIGISATAQNPFEEFDYEPKIGTLSNGKYIEDFDNDTIVRIGSIMLNTNQMLINGFVITDTVYSEATLDPTIMSRWMSPDPLSEEFPEWSPYNFVENNPIRYSDPLGLSPFDVVINGSEKQAAFQELQASVQGQLNLSMDANGKVSYTQVGNGTLSADAQQLTTAIDDSSIVVNVAAENTTLTKSGNLYIGGAFGGNTVTNNPSGNTVVANQEVNPNVLSLASSGNGKPGADILHEVTEAYQGALITQQSGNSVGQATMADVNNPNSVYNRAHSSATPQSGNIYQDLFNAAGQKLQMQNGQYPAGIKKVEWFVTDSNGNRVVIQTLQ